MRHVGQATTKNHMACEEYVNGKKQKRTVYINY